jgi:hypothetical protein
MINFHEYLSIVLDVIHGDLIIVVCLMGNFGNLVYVTYLYSSKFYLNLFDSNY